MIKRIMNRIKKIDVTGLRFVSLNGSNGHLFFDQFCQGTTFYLNICGLAISRELDEYHKDIYIPAFAQISFEQVQGVYVELYPVPSKEGVDCLRYTLGNCTNEDTFEYAINGGMRDYKGKIKLKIYASGNVRLIFKAKDRIPLKKYLKDPSRYTMKETIYHYTNTPGQRLLSITAPYGGSTAFEYDDIASRLTKIIEPDGHTTLINYHWNGNNSH